MSYQSPGDAGGPSESDAPPADDVSVEAEDQEPELDSQGTVVEGMPAEATPVDAESGEPEVSADHPSDDFTPEQIDALVAERDQFLDAYRRTAADFDNFRKLSQKRIADEVTRNQGAFVERLLPVLDAIDAARAQGSEHDMAGVDAVAGQLFGFLEKEGLERVDPAGQQFDPNLAEAVMHEPGDHEHPVVTEVLRTGYTWNGRVIRAAMVKVAG